MSPSYKTSQVALTLIISDFQPDPNSKETRNPRTSIVVGRYTLISSGATLHPPYRFIRDPSTNVLEPSYYPQKIGENVFIGPNAFVGAAQIGSNVVIGEGAIIERGVMVGDRVKILEGSVLQQGMVVPVGSVVGKYRVFYIGGPE